MPSCVVRCCRNNTTTQKKNQGVTFHRFPTGNEVWTNDWIKVIRNSRAQNDWIPSKTSVICSIHFDVNDLYTTKNGLRRVITYAVPKLLLFELYEGHTETRIFRPLRKVCHQQHISQSSSLPLPQPPPATSAEAMNSVPISSIEMNIEKSNVFICNKCGHKNEYSNLPMTSLYLQKTPPSFAEVTCKTEPPTSLEDSDLLNTQIPANCGTVKGNSEDLTSLETLNLPRTQMLPNFEVVICKSETLSSYKAPASPSKTYSMTQVSPNFIAVTCKPEPPSSIEPSSSPSTPLSVPITSTIFRKQGIGTSLQQPLFQNETVDLFRSKNFILEKKLRRRKILVDKQQRKIKTLNQKVRRLVCRNRYLKDILKTLKKSKPLPPN